MYSWFFASIWTFGLLNLAVDTKSHETLLKSSRKWITELFSEAEHKFNLEMAINPNCRNDFRIYLSHLRNQSVWAVRMKESSEWPSVGLYSGMMDHLGNWAECLKASGPKGITGRYCLAEIVVKKFPDPFALNSAVQAEGCECEDCSAWDILRKCTNDPVRADRRIIQWAICLPSSCSANDLQISLDHLIIPIFNSSDINVTVSTNSFLCSSNAPQKYPTEYYYTRTVFLSLITLVIASTFNSWIIPEKYIESKGLMIKMFNCFSAVQSCRSLTESSQETNNAIYFLKFILMIFIVMGHRWIFSLVFPLFQTEELEMDYSSGGMFFLTQLNILDVFLMISGFLLYRFSVDPMRKVGFPYIGIHLVFRVMKTLPAQGFIILFAANILPHLGDGPLWKSTMNWMSQPCKTRWLFNLMATNNLVTSDKQCLIPTWYLAADFQNSVIGIFLLFILTKNTRFGILSMVFTFVISAMYTTISAYSMGLSGFYVMGVAKTRRPSSYSEYNLFYNSSIPRVSPFLLGMTIGLIVERLKKRNYRFPPTLAIILLMLSLGIDTLVQHHGFTLMHSMDYSRLWKALFAGFYRPLYVLPFATLGCIYFVSGIKFLDLVCTHRIFFALSRIGFSVLLCSYVFQIYHMSIQRSNLPTSNKLNLYLWSLGDLIISFVIGFLYYLIVEGPFTNLFKLLKTVCLRRWAEKKVI